MVQNTLYSHFTHRSQDFDCFDGLHYVYQQFQDSEKMHQLHSETEIPVPDDDSLYPYINNDIKYGLFEDIVDSYYLDTQIKDDFQCDQDCYTYQQESTIDDHSISCTHTYDHITKHLQDLSDRTYSTFHGRECIINITNQYTSNTDTVTKINHIPYQTIAYNENGMFTTKLMNDTPVEIFIDNGATPSILPLHTYNKFPIYIHTLRQKVTFPYIQEEV